MPNELPNWLTDVGGWGVVLLIVRWMMMRIDKLIAASDVNMTAAIAEFRAFRLQELEQHASLEEGQQRILDHLTSPHRRK
jgi:hypothetical protein